MSKNMSLHARYAEVSELSGISEEVIRRVYKATRTSLVASLKRGEKATLPGICTINASVRNRINIGGEQESYIKLKATPSSALTTELDKLSGFESAEEKEAEQREEEERLKILNIKQPVITVRTKQINALL